MEQVNTPVGDTTQVCTSEVDAKQVDTSVVADESEISAVATDVVETDMSEKTSPLNTSSSELLVDANEPQNLDELVRKDIIIEPHSQEIVDNKVREAKPEEDLIENVASALKGGSQEINEEEQDVEDVEENIINKADIETSSNNNNVEKPQPMQAWTQNVEPSTELVIETNKENSCENIKTIENSDNGLTNGDSTLKVSQFQILLKTLVKSSPVFLEEAYLTSLHIHSIQGSASSYSVSLQLITFEVNLHLV